jgi:hypothetical protein
METGSIAMEKARKINITNKGGNGKVMIKKNRNFGRL